MNYIWFCGNATSKMSNGLPVRCSHEGVSWGNNGGRAKVSQFDLTWLCEQDVSCLHIPERGETRGIDQLREMRLVSNRTVCYRLGDRKTHNSARAQTPLHNLISGGTVCAFSPVFVLSLVRSVGEEKQNRYW